MYPIFEVSDAEIAFPTAKNIPPLEKIPKEFKDSNADTEWHHTFRVWFYTGGNLKTCIPKDGVDKTKAIRAIKSIMGSYSPKHEHKTAAVAWLLSEWFDKFEIDIGKKTC